MAIALVNSVGAAPGGSGGATASIDTTGATLLVVTVSWYSPGGAITVTDSKGNTYTGLTQRTQLGTTSHRIFYKLSPTVGSGHTFTVSGSGIYPIIIGYAFSGVVSFQSESGRTGSSVSTLDCGSIIPNANGALIFTGSGGDTTVTDSISGYTLTSFPRVGGTSVQGAGAWLVQTTAAEINPTWTFSPAQAQTVVASAVFLPTTITAPTIAVVSSTSISFSGTGSWSASGGTTTAIDTTGANLLVFSIGWFGGGAPTTISDSKGNTWTALTQYTNSSSYRIYYAKNATVGSGHTFTSAFSGSVWPVGFIYALSGAHVTAPFDVENGNSTSSGSGPLTTGLITPTVNGTFIVSGIRHGNASNSSMTISGGLSPNLVIVDGGGGAYLIQNTAAATNPSWGYSGGSNGGATSIAAFKPLVAAATAVESIQFSAVRPD